MRVALLSYNAQAGDAIGNQVAEKLAFFLDRGADVRVFVESDRRLHPTLRSHCRVLAESSPEGDGWEFLSSADVVIIEYAQYFRLLEWLPFLAGGKPRLLFDYHGITPANLWGAHNREALERGAEQRGLVWCADAALVHSRFTYQELRSQTAYPAERLSILEHPIDTSHFSPGGAGPGLRDRPGLRDASVLLFVGRLAVNKRVPLLIEALDRLRDGTPPVHLVLVGDATDVYQVEANRCRQRAAELGLANRVHFLGHLREESLLNAYRSADLFAMPSRHEGFCIPVIEAMACGLPVVAARAGALPETVAGAGLTFTADDPDDLARQVRRVLGRTDTPSELGDSQAIASAPSPPRVAVVSPRYGTHFVGGAERSLGMIATALHGTGCKVEVFTICAERNRRRDDWSADRILQPNGIPVSCFRADAFDKARQQQAFHDILQGNGCVVAETERLYLDHSIRSTGLLESLRQRIDQFDAVIVGPYLYGLAFDIATAFPQKTLLLPCFHDEPLARLAIWREVYSALGGILYHSHEEKDWAEVALGLNHPGAICMGTFVDVDTPGDAERGHALVGGRLPYVVYCGRYLREKNLPMLLDYARRYQEANPSRFRFVFLGEGEVTIPPEPWARDLGFVDEVRKRGILAGAAVLAQLSRNESLSLVALEAWAQGIPVLAAADCTVMMGHLRRGGGGRTVDGYPSFAAALDDLWQRPEAWQRMGQQGRDYVRGAYGSRDHFAGRLLEAIRGLALPLAERMRRQGLLRAAQLERSAWRERFGQVIEQLLDRPSRQRRDQLEVRPRAQSRVVSAGSESLFIPVRIANRGTHPALSEGPGRVVLRSLVVDERGRPSDLPALDTPLPALLIPGQEIVAAMRVAVPAAPGTYQVLLLAVPRGAGQKRPGAAPEHWPASASFPMESSLQLIVEQSASPTADRCCTPSLHAVHQALSEAALKQRLPVEYLDVTQGFLAKWKRWLKGKLLGNFKHAYVDVLSRQQSAFNRQVLIALQELTECCAVLDHALAVSDAGRTIRTTDPAPRALMNPNVASFAVLIERTLTAGNANEIALLLHHLVHQLAEAQQQLAALQLRLTPSGLDTQGTPAVPVPGQKAREGSFPGETEVEGPED